MKGKTSAFSICCVVFLFVFALFMAWYVYSASSLASDTAEVRKNLETSRGREGKQQDEYDRAVEELPQVQAQLLEKQPLAEEAEAAVKALKERRNELRTEKKALEEALGITDAEGAGNE